MKTTKEFDTGRLFSHDDHKDIKQISTHEIMDYIRLYMKDVNKTDGDLRAFCYWSGRLVGEAEKKKQISST